MWPVAIILDCRALHVHGLSSIIYLNGKEAIKGRGPRHTQTVFKQHHYKGDVLRCIPTLNQQRRKKPDFIISRYIHRQFIY